MTCRWRRRANGPTSALKWTASAPAARARSGSSRWGSPRRTNSRLPARAQLVVELVPGTRAGTASAGPEAWRPPMQAVVEAEHRDDRVVPVQGRAQRRMVMQPQVPAQPDSAVTAPSAAARPAGGSRRSARRSRPDEQRVGQVAEASERQRVVDLVADDRSAVLGGERVTVMPQPVGPAAAGRRTRGPAPTPQSREVQRTGNPWRWSR